jgi:hypothetical protein
MPAPEADKTAMLPPVPSMTGMMGQAASDRAAGAVAAAPAPGAETTAPVPPAVPRKIIYNANIELVVESINSLEQSIRSLVKENGGFLSESNQSSYNREQQQASWKVRVPVDRFETFVSAVVRLGEVRQNRIDSQDVTEEFVDLEARIHNKQEEEKRLLKHLDETTGKLEDILSVERELTRVRGEIEQMQGRLRYLANQSDLSTVSISATEWKEFKPPVAASFRTEISRTFTLSVEHLTHFVQGIVLILVALSPWLPLILILALLVLWLIRRLWNNLRQQARTLVSPRPFPPPASSSTSASL